MHKSDALECGKNANLLGFANCCHPQGCVDILQGLFCGMCLSHLVDGSRKGH